ncbi:MAG: stage 0 sporulation family protein [Anaerolineales bacterium]|nr:MAG: stage 0 sporulation family protein [Anaerolineales bacterium]
MMGMAESAALQRIAAIRFQPVGKLYHFNASKVEDLQPGDYVIVSTSRGNELGEVVGFVENGVAVGDGPHKLIERRATPRELVLQRTWRRRELEVMIDCRAKAAELGIKGVKIVRAEYSYDGSSLVFLYSSEGDEKVELSALTREMKQVLRKPRIEFRQIGPRDVAKILSGMGACGLEERCCSRFLTEFSPISIKMAKAQGISLNPQEITGMCGRLRCCLVYEYEQYAEARKTLPKRKKKVVTPKGVGRVVDVMPLKNAVMVVLEDDRRVEFLQHEIQPYDELKKLQEKANAPCDRHENGECDCNRKEQDK